MGTKQNYISAAKGVIEEVRAKQLVWYNDVSYYDEQVVFVHLEHFASQGPLIDQWLGKKKNPRARFGLAARVACNFAFSKDRPA
jgi:hypothetical protein